MSTFESPLLGLKMTVADLRPDEDGKRLANSSDRILWSWGFEGLGV